MRKLYFLFLSVLLTVCLPCLALAGCALHPDAAVWTSTETTCQAIDDHIHCQTIWRTEVCSACGTQVSRTAWNTASAPHELRLGMCLVCGLRVMSTGYDKDAIPSSLSAEEVAAMLGDRTIGGSLRVSSPGYVFSQPGFYSWTVGSVHTDENFIVDDYRYVDGMSWFRVWYHDRDAWIPASTARFLISYADTFIPGADYSRQVGRTCVILVNRGNVRSQPGMDTRVVASVYRHQVYTVLGCSEGPDGKVWYRICTDDASGWISSGIARLQ